MLDFFKKKETPKYVPEGMLKESEREPERQYYSLGPTTEGRVMLRVYYGNVSMDRNGIDTMIKTLEASKAWLEDQSGKQPDNGCQVGEKPL